MSKKTSQTVLERLNDRDIDIHLVIPHAWTTLKLIPAITFGIMIYSARKHYKNWNNGFFASMVHIDAVTILKSPKYNDKYQIFPRVIFHKQLQNVIDNEHGIKQIQKAAKKCTFQQPFIQLSRIADHWYFHNSIICALEQDMKLLWFKRDIDINDNLNNLSTNILYRNYILAIAMPWNLTQTDLKTCFLKELDAENEYQISGHKVHRKIRGFMINEQTMKQLSQLKEFNNLKDMDTTQWTKYLDCDGFERGSASHLDVIFKWTFVKRIIEKYQLNGNNQGQWSQPLCKVQIPVLFKNKQEIDNQYNIFHCNVYHPSQYR